MNLSFFIEMAWKSAFIAGVALLLAAILKSRSPADRAAVLQVGLALLVLLPLVSLLLPAWQIEMGAAAEGVQPLMGPLLEVHEPAASESAAMQAQVAKAPAASPSGWSDPAVIVAIFYFAGFAVTLARLLGGLATLRRWTAESEAVSSPHWMQALERLTAVSARAPVPLRLSHEIRSPLSWGWSTPVILIDAQSHARGEDAEAILAHEMAHILRRDWPALMLSRIASALFWFNPLVWLVGRAYVRYAEEAADCQALAQVEPTSYAQALLGCAAHSRRNMVPANSIATSDLARRVHAVLEGGGRRIPSGSRLCAATILGCLALAGPVSAMKLIAGAAAKKVAAEPVGPAAVAPAKVQPTMIAPAPVITASLKPVRIAATVWKAPAAAPKALPAVAAAEPEIAATAPPAAPAEPVRLAALAAEPAAPVRKAERESYEEAMREVRAASAEAARAGERAAKAGERAAVIARRQARQSMAQGAVNMEKGAEDMKRGARHMAEEAVKLRDPAYRELQIARQAAWGQRVTHQQLIDSIPQLEKGSRDMLKGAEDMRRGAEQMRRSSQD